MTEQEIAARAERFWRDAGQVEPFPRSLESAVTWALPIAITKLPRLGLDGLRRWLEQRRIPFSSPVADRPLRGALFARVGHGLVFLDGSDSDDERRFSLGHEVAHFLCDYLDPRERALEALGDSIRDVLDGHRSPAPEERLTALLRDVELGLYVHWMDRRPDGAVARATILEGEDRADRLALELLAPRSTVMFHLDTGRPTTINRLTSLLRSEFGLPADPAERYAAMLLVHRQAARSFREWLGVPACRTSPDRSE
jgi:uncharacterized protein DUF955